MSVERCLAINARLRAAGVTVHEASGWKTRGNGQTSAYEGGLVHHTATGYGKALPGTGIYELLFTKGRTGSNPLAPPLCNYAGNDDGSLTCGAAGPANHAGASGGRSMGPLPTTSLFNRRVLGLEIVYPGTSPMRDAQYRSALIWARVVADVVGGGDIERVRAHAETSVTGKWDPGYASGKTIDMAAFRRAADTVLEDDMTPAQAAQLALVQRIATENQRRIGLARADIAALVQLVAADKDMDPAEFARLVDVAVARHTPTAAQNAAAIQPLLVESMRDVIPDEQANLILQKLAEKLGAPEGN